VEQDRGLTIATRVLAYVVGVLFVVLAATGVALTFRYQPTVSYANVASLEHHSIVTLRGVHRLASRLFVLAVGGLAVSSIGLFIARRRRFPIAFSLLAGLFALAGSVTGYLLPWDQMSLWAVSVGTNMRGYSAILHGHKVRFVLVGSTEVGTSTVQQWFWVHAVVVPVLIVGAVGAVLFAARRRAAIGPDSES